MESPLTAINSAVAAVQKIPESRSALQSGCKVALNFKTKNVIPDNAGLEIKKNSASQFASIFLKFSRKFKNFSRKSNQPKQNRIQVIRQLLTS